MFRTKVGVFVTEVIPMCYIKLLRIYVSQTHLFVIVKLCI